MKKITAVAVVAIIAYLMFWPVPIEPIHWQAPVSDGYTGVYAVNAKLEQFDAMSLAGLTGPEALAVDEQGKLYATTHEGWIVRWLPGRDQAEKWVEVGGRPLGLAFDAAGNLWIANAYKGLQKITPAKVVSLELSEFNGQTLAYPDDLAISSSGKIYFSDASTKFAARDWGGTLPASLLDLLEHGRSGRIIEYDPATKGSREVLSNLSFANGVTIEPAGSFLLVVETGEYRVWRYWLEGQRSGVSEIIIDNLPGFPDNIHIGNHGRYWLGLTAPRNGLVDSLSARPWLRKVIQRLPKFVHPEVEHYGMVLAINENGEVLENLQAPSGAVYATTGATETDDYVYVTSLTAPFLARYRKSDLHVN